MLMGCYLCALAACRLFHFSCFHGNQFLSLCAYVFGCSMRPWA